ncbi:MAG: molybdopterin-synthase adenylyltransferase MoeB [Anaerolineales bacterium]
MHLSQKDYERYSRQLLIPEIGVTGQEVLKNSSVLIVGAGGLGSPVSLYLAGAGIGNIGIVDYDPVEISNLHRQVVHGTSSLGLPKVESAKSRLQELNPEININIFNEPFTSTNAMQIAEGYDVIVDGTDNFPARYLINDVSFYLGIPFVFGSVFRFEGQVSVFNKFEGPCYRCIFPEPPPPGTVPTCAEAGVLGVLPGFIGMIQATETIKLILDIGTSLSGRLLIYDALDMNFEKIKINKNQECSLCGSNPTVTELIDYEEFCGFPGTQLKAITSGEITPKELERKIKNGENFVLVDIREPHELEISSLKKAIVIPLNQLAEHKKDLLGYDEIVIFCRTGSRTIKGAAILKDMGLTNVMQLKGGINAWAREIDTSMRVY